MTKAPSAASTKPLRIAVIGAGALGSATAYRLARRGCDVTLVDSSSPGMGTTGNSFAWLNAFGKHPRRYHELNASSVDECALLAQEVGGEWLQMSGGLHWADPADDAAQAKLTTAVERLRGWGYSVETLSPDVVARRLEPDLDLTGTSIHEIYRVPQEGWVHGPGMVRALVTAASKHEARLLRDRVLAIHTDSDGSCRIEVAGDESLSVNLVVNAAGPAATEIAEMAGTQVSVTQSPGVLVLTAPSASRIRHVIHAPEIHLRPDLGRRLMLHKVEYDAFWEAARDQGYRALHDDPVRALASIAPGLAGCQVERLLVGVRPMPSDGLPIVGFDRQMPLMYHMVAHSAITLCALLSKLAAEEICGNSSPLLEPYSPGRLTDLARR